MAAVFGLLQWAPETLAGFFRALGLPVAERVQAGPQLGDGSPYVGGAFDLIDHEGKPRRDADFRGRYMLVYFGYTYCPDVC
ncbi:MAG: SCO family protein, partial [Alphaproteobacteria bacterium]|nr:SCO family protein [Alphaproteobacteria bacterium]